MAASHPTHTPSTSTPAIAYARCSSAQQERSVEQQLDALRSHADSGGLNLVETFTDEAISGSPQRLQGSCRRTDEPRSIVAGRSRP